jgi:OmcA/MtrC family decaheme c-type cytochrome
MIHGIHGNSKRAYPFTHGNAVVGVFNMDGTSATGAAPLASSVENFAAEVAYPDASLNCNACHVNNSYKTDQSPLGSVVFKGPGVTDPNAWMVISPKAATCTACHDGKTASGLSVISHVTQFGGATFGDKTQADVTTTPSATSVPRETCDDCHASGGFKSVDIVHGLK